MAGIFRLLNADEIDCRIGSIKENGLSLLLYKDARCDMNILDECFGPFGWQRHHSRDNANCIVSIYDSEKNEWIEKEDVGTESNTEAAKGLASDSFKRACVNWGIGRELYTAPFIWIPSSMCTISNKRCNDKFRVVEIGYDNTGNITKLIIANDTKGIDVFFFPKTAGKAPTPTPQPAKPDFTCADCGKPISDYFSSDGKRISAKRHADSCMKKFGRVLCLDCVKNASDPQ